MKTVKIIATVVLFGACLSAGFGLYVLSQPKVVMNVDSSHDDIERNSQVFSVTFIHTTNEKQARVPIRLSDTHENEIKDSLEKEFEFKCGDFANVEQGTGRVKRCEFVEKDSK